MKTEVYRGQEVLNMHLPIPFKMPVITFKLYLTFPATAKQDQCLLSEPVISSPQTKEAFLL